MPPKAAGFPLSGTLGHTGTRGVGLGQVSYIPLRTACQGLVVMTISGRILCLWHLEIGSASSLLLPHLLLLRLLLHFYTFHFPIRLLFYAA